MHSQIPRPLLSSEEGEWSLTPRNLKYECSDHNSPLRQPRGVVRLIELRLIRAIRWGRAQHYAVRQHKRRARSLRKQRLFGGIDSDPFVVGARPNSDWRVVGNRKHHAAASLVRGSQCPVKATVFSFHVSSL